MRVSVSGKAEVGHTQDLLVPSSGQLDRGEPEGGGN